MQFLLEQRQVLSLDAYESYRILFFFHQQKDTRVTNKTRQKMPAFS